MRRARSWPGLALACLLLTLLSGSATVVLDQAPARAACSGAGCDGKWPDTEGCASGTVLLDSRLIEWEEWIGGPWEVHGSMMLRYSPSCRAAFAEFNMLAARAEWFFPVFWSQPQYGGRMTPVQHAAGGGWFRMVSGDGVPENGNREVFYSAMVNWDRSVRVCIRENDYLDYEPDRPPQASTFRGDCTRWM
ncbi:DUF2690 domain-containing protein [Micromonospora sp. CPCC 206061]|uniref:DUF2690 domain-containing protein n=1 Tax=Micromonospora sp. CPCC 206061 TaxID=3122410 RepID=UPI002FF26217